MGKARFRPAELIKFHTASTSIPQGQNIMREAIARTCKTMHGRHAWSVHVDGQDHTISFGFVRIASVTQAVMTAKHLCATLPNARVACYHSQLPRLHRHAMEVVLDDVLQRSKGAADTAQRLMSQPQMVGAIRKSQERGINETIFIVVATPVEEVGRDHDFDWGVFEPSSTQSIVQAAGRINRHRLVNVDQPNVAVLCMNFSKITTRYGPVFTHPGLESAQCLYGSQNLVDLIDWQAIDDAGQIDARLRYMPEIHPFADFDDRSCEAQIRTYSRRFLNSNSDLWMGHDTYAKAKLRQGDQKENWSRNETGKSLREEPAGDPKNKWRKAWFHRDISTEQAPSNAWLTWSHDEFLFMAQEIGISTYEAFAAEVRPKTQTRDLKVNLAFGYYLEP